MDIRVQQTQLGASVIAVNGRQTCSFVDPKKEANEWVNHYRSLCEGKRSLIVLGLGSGYHLEALAENFSQEIFLIEQNKDLIEHFKSHFSKVFSRLQIFSLEEDAMERMLGCIAFPYGVLTFAPAVMSARDRYHQVYEALVGRSKENLERQFQLRGVDHFFCPTEIDMTKPADSYRLLAQNESLSSKWKNLFKMMGDLIK